MRIQLSDHFTYKKLLRFTFPSIMMLIFTSVYGVVDGFFVSNFVGKTPFAAVNFIFPLLMVFGAIGSMFGAGGSALIAKTIAEGDLRKAKRLFSLFVYLSAGIGAVIAVVGSIFVRPIAAWLGAEGAMLNDCVTYGRILLLALPVQMLQFEFQSFFVTAEKPQLGLYVTLAAGVTNMVLDALLVAVFPLGLPGAATATAVSQLVGGAVPIVYFARRNDSLLQLTKTRYDGAAVFKAAGNGSSEFLSNVSMSVVSMLYNAQLIRYAGENGVAAYGTMMYVSFVFVAIFIGYSVGTAPIIAYHYGAGNRNELKNILKKSLVLVGLASVGMLVLSEALARPLSLLFVGYDRELFDMTLTGFIIFSFSFVFSGLPIFGSSFFTALNNGAVSALISFLRTVVFQVAAVLLLPLVWGLDGIWISIVVAEVAAAMIAVVCWVANKRKYGY